MLHESSEVTAVELSPSDIEMNATLTTLSHRNNSPNTIQSIPSIDTPHRPPSPTSSSPRRGSNDRAITSYTLTEGSRFMQILHISHGIHYVASLPVRYIYSCIFPNLEVFIESEAEQHSLDDTSHGSHGTLALHTPPTELETTTALHPSHHEEPMRLECLQICLTVKFIKTAITILLAVAVVGGLAQAIIYLCDALVSHMHIESTTVGGTLVAMGAQVHITALNYDTYLYFHLYLRVCM